MYLIICFIYSALYFIVILCSIVFIIKLVCFSHEGSSLFRENIFENICCYIRACLWEVWGTCADLLNHSLESNSAYFLSASITWCCALKRHCNQEENISEPTETTWKYKAGGKKAMWQQLSVNNKLILECYRLELYNTMVKIQCASFSELQHSSAEVWCQFGSNFQISELIILFGSQAVMFTCIWLLKNKDNFVAVETAIETEIKSVCSCFLDAL